MQHPLQAAIGRHLRKYRLAKDLKEKQLASELGFSTSTLSKIERGAYPSLKLNMLLKIAGLTGIVSLDLASNTLVTSSFPDGKIFFMEGQK